MGVIQIVRSLCFNFLFVFGTLLLAFCCLPLLFCSEFTVIRFVSRPWSKGTVWLLRNIVGIHITYEGVEHLDPNKPSIIACQHQSVIETIVMYEVVPYPCFILKRELLFLPLFGWFLMGAGMIAIDRSKGVSAMKTILQSAKRKMAMGRHIVIFPEGTRVRLGDKKPYQPGVAALYTSKSLEAEVIPVAVSTGKCWGRNSFIKTPGTVTLRFLPPIKKGLKKDQFMSDLEQQIVAESKKLLSAA